MTGSEVLDELNAGLAEADEDLWYHLTAMGMTERSLDEAKDATDLLASHVPNLRDVRVADLGCGVGRHLVALAQHTTNLLGVEASPSLARLAAEFVPDARVETASFHDLAELGAFDVVCAFSHILMLADGREGVIGNLQLIRGAMPDYGLLVVEVMSVVPGVLEWSGPQGARVVEERQATSQGMQHHFRIKSATREWQAELPSAVVAPADWPAVAEAGGFHLEAAETTSDSNGASPNFYFLRAQKGYNYLSDLGEFLESWAHPEHPRNRREVKWATPDATERRRPEGAWALGQGASLSKHHQDFADALESRIRPLVLEFAERWNYVTYSSCGGHLVDKGPPEVYSEAYCGLVTFSNRHLSTLADLVSAATCDLQSSQIRVELRTRALHGSGTVLNAADVLFKRRDTSVSWQGYEPELRRAVDAMCSKLGELRERP